MGEGMQANTPSMAPRDKRGGHQGAREDVAPHLTWMDRHCR